MKHSILVVDDEREIADLVEVYLKNEGYPVFKAYNGADALAIVETQPLSLAILDVMLPDMDGFSLCQKIRETHFFPILMLSAKGEDTDKIMGLTLGADDYITKPFSIRELVTRVHAVLRRPRTSTTPPQVTTPLIVGDLILDPVAHQVRVGETTVELTRTEFELLVALALRPGQVLTRHDLVTEVWDTTWVGDERIVDVHIGNLRRKLGTDTRGRGFIDTVRGVGYRVGQP